jgi:hypothetical protein
MEGLSNILLGVIIGLELSQILHWLVDKKKDDD